MGYTIAEKIIKSHLVEGEMIQGTDIGLRIDQTLTQDATGTMAYLEFEAMGVPRVRTERSVAYIDHNTLQTGFENAASFRASQKSTAFISPARATVYVIRFTLNASAFQARRLSAPTAIPRPAAVSVCSLWAQAVWTLLLQWAAALITLQCLKWFALISPADSPRGYRQRILSLRCFAECPSRAA